jgi:hypothetical protein
MAMKKLAFAVGLLLSALLVASCATTQGPDDLSPSQTALSCQPGTYYCPGEVPGCCPNGWGCASTHCIRPRAKGPGNTASNAPDRSCQPGFYYCPGEVPGCCPNGWGCASTHCIRPKAKGR